MKRSFILFLFGMISSFSTYGAENNILIAYFGRVGNTNYSQNVDATASASIVINNGSNYGTTEFLARQIQQEIGGDLFPIEVVNPYPEDYGETTDVAREEQRKEYFPPLKRKVENLDKYDTIFLGYPNWWGTMPRAVLSFLKENNLENKKIIPFVTHQGSGLGQSISDLIEILPNNDIERNGLAVRGKTSQTEVKEWLDKVLK